MKNQIYKLIINDLTNHCYKNCLDYFSSRASILDVGIGNGVMFKNYHSLIKSKRLKITGIDINQHYLNHCDCLIKKYRLGNHVEIYCNSIETYDPAPEENFDFILFSMSFMLIQDQHLVLERIKNWLKPGGKIIFFQTMYKNRFRLMEFVKPKLKYFTTVDFGKVTYDKEFYSSLAQQQMRVMEDRLIKKEWFKGEYRMIITSLNS